ncbi:MAG: peptide-methionine (S)-S-oxide reductase MsrA [Luteolibacter sp.]
MNWKFLARLLAIFVVPVIASCEPKSIPEDAMKPAPMPEVPEGHEVAILGAGCFWCIEAAYNQIEGVHAAVSGYSGGKTENPTYEQITTGETGHAEVVKVVFNPEKISYERVLAWFWDLHDPTTLNRQGNDIGTQYRSAIFFTSEPQREAAEASKKAAQANFKNPIVTEITKAGPFYPAENYHQGYYFENKSKNPYCRFVIEPKLKKLDLKH